MSFSFLLMGLLLASLVTNTVLLSRISLHRCSPLTPVSSSSGLQISASLTFCLRVLAQRTSYGAVIEILFVAIAFVITLSAHRNGMIHRLLSYR